MALKEPLPKKDAILPEPVPRKAGLRTVGGMDFGHKEFDIAEGKAPLPAAQQANLDEARDSSEARADDYAQRAGLNEQQQAEEHYQINQSQAMLKTSMQETSWQHALTTLGFEEQAVMTMIAEQKKNEAEHRAAYTNLVTTIAKLVVVYYTGGAAAV